MPIQVSKTQIANLRAQAERALSRAKNVVAKSEEAIGQVVQSTEIAGAAFAAGVLKGRYDTFEIAGVPADLGGATVAHALAFFGGGKYAEHVHNVADGVLASYMTQLGVGVGARMRQESERAARGATTSGDIGPGSHSLTDAEQQALRAAGLR